MAPPWISFCVLVVTLCNVAPGYSQQTMFPPGPVDEPILITNNDTKIAIYRSNSLTDEDRRHLQQVELYGGGTHLWYIGDGRCVYTGARHYPQYEVKIPGRFPCNPEDPTTVAPSTTTETAPTARPTAQPTTTTTEAVNPPTGSQPTTAKPIDPVTPPPGPNGGGNTPSSSQPTPGGPTVPPGPQRPATRSTMTPGPPGPQRPTTAPSDTTNPPGPQRPASG